MSELVSAANPIIKTPAEEKGYAVAFTGILPSGRLLDSIESVTVHGNREDDDPELVLEYVADSKAVNAATVVDRISGKSHPVGEVALFRLAGGIAGRDYHLSIVAMDDAGEPNTHEGFVPVYVRDPLTPR